MHSVTDNRVPPAGHTGAQNTNGAFIDWLSCTFLDGDKAGTIAKELGQVLDDSTRWNTGAMGYTDVWSIFGGWIGENPDRPDMGVHLELPGRAMDTIRLQTRKTDVELVVWFVGLGAQFTRVDVAYDVFEQDKLDLAQIKQAIKDNLCVSRWRNAKEYATYRLNGGGYVGGCECGGFTFGSRSSRAYLRMYDKRQERLQKIGECDKPYWVRLEMEYKKENAQAVARMIQDTKGLDWYGANLRYYLDIKEPGQTDTNRSRLKTAAWWIELTDSIKTRLPLLKKVVQDAVLAAKRWIRDQVAPTLAFLTTYDGGDTAWLRDTMMDGQGRMSNKYIHILKAQEEGV